MLEGKKVVVTFHCHLFSSLKKHHYETARFMKKLYPFNALPIIILVASACSNQELVVPQNAPASSEEINSTRSFSEIKSQHDGEKVDSYVAQSWYALMMKLIIETPGHTPPIAARSFGYAGVALYESLAGQMPRHQSLAGQLNGLSSIPRSQYGNSYSAPLTANAALAKITKYLFQNASLINLQRIDSLESANENLYTIHVSEVIVKRSRDFGQSVADAVYNWSVTDGGHEAYLHNFPADYIPPTGEDKWIPTLPLFQNAQLPYWGNNRPMVTANNAGPDVDPSAHPTFSLSPESDFFAAAYEVYATSLVLTPEQKTIALYWADGVNTFTPPGHNIAIALQMARQNNFNLNQVAILLAKTGIALNDAAIVCWRAKYQTNLLRPITFIRSTIDPFWTSSIATPPFPSYTSGHSTFSSAVASILTAEIGNQISFTDSSKVAEGFSPRSFNNFMEAAQEAAVSRLYGGIHYSFDNDNGFICGQRIALHVEQLMW
jgi:membrane-associated phospholipid phosphatase